jgi:hypothetical protein
MAGSALVIDTLQSLLDSEQGSIFRFMREGTPYLARATVETRAAVERMAGESDRHAAALAALIEGLGGVLRPAAVQPENQYLSYLSLNFLLPKLADAKRTSIERYQNALRALGAAGVPAEVLAVLEAHLAEHRADLAVLERVIKS